MLPRRRPGGDDRSPARVYAQVAGAYTLLGAALPATMALVYGLLGGTGALVLLLTGALYGGIAGAVLGTVTGCVAAAIATADRRSAGDR